MVRRTFDGGTLHSERDTSTGTDDTPSGTPLMTFTLIDGDTDDDQALESEVLAAFGSTRSTTSSGATTAGPSTSGSTLRRILGNNAPTSVPSVDPTPAATVTSRLLDPQPEAPGPDESGSMLRPHPAVDRLDNEFTLVPPLVSPNHPASRGFLRRRR
jgi:hypothetical protein